MKLTTITFVAGAAIASIATADTVAPGDVKFDDYGAVAASLTGVAGDPANGRKVFMNRKKGNCLACHVNDDMSEQSFHGEVGPELNGVGDRWETAELRGIVANAKDDVRWNDYARVLQRCWIHSAVEEFFRQINPDGTRGGRCSCVHFHVERVTRD